MVLCDFVGEHRRGGNKTSRRPCAGGFGVTPRGLQGMHRRAGQRSAAGACTALGQPAWGGGFRTCCSPNFFLHALGLWEQGTGLSETGLPQPLEPYLAFLIAFGTQRCEYRHCHCCDKKGQVLVTQLAVATVEGPALSRFLHTSQMQIFQYNY